MRGGVAGASLHASDFLESMLSFLESMLSERDLFRARILLATIARTAGEAACPSESLLACIGLLEFSWDSDLRVVSFGVSGTAAG